MPKSKLDLSESELKFLFFNGMLLGKFSFRCSNRPDLIFINFTGIEIKEGNALPISIRANLTQQGIQGKLVREYLKMQDLIEEIEEAKEASLQ
jgi:hypothetical protein